MVQVKFFGWQIHFGKEQAFGKNIVRDRYSLKQIFGMDKFFQLFVTFGHEEQLEGKCILLRILIKLWQKRIFSKSLQNQTGVVMAGQQMGKCCLACADISFHCNKMIVHEDVNIRNPDGLKLLTKFFLPPIHPYIPVKVVERICAKPDVYNQMLFR